MALTGRGDFPIASAWFAHQITSYSRGQVLVLVKQDADAVTATIMRDFFFDAAGTAAFDEGALWYIPIQAEA